MNFEQALSAMKQGKKVKRVAFGDGICVRAQFPTETSMNTLPYIVMEKRGNIFPVQLSCEAVFAEDWEIIS